jgi:arylsulfatase A-like enzyme
MKNQNDKDCTRSLFVRLTCHFASRMYQDPEKIQEWTALYYALIQEIDDEVGALMETLGDEASNTLVIFTSDHGEMLGAHGKREKNDFYEGRVINLTLHSKG